jgi:hypothetical protein
MTTNRERVCSQTVAKNDTFAFRIWWQRALYCLASLPCIACRIPFWSSTMWGSRQSRFEPVARDRCSLHFSSFLSCHCHLRKSIRLIAHRKGLRASRTYRTLELHWASFNFYNLVYACLRLLRWLPSGPCFKWWTAAVQGQTSGWCHAPLTLFRGSTSYLSKKPGNHFNPVDDSMLPAPIVGCPRLMWAIALRACWYCRGSYYLAPGFTCGSFQHIPIQYWIHHSSPVFYRICNQETDAPSKCRFGCANCGIVPLTPLTPGAICWANLTCFGLGFWHFDLTKTTRWPIVSNQILQFRVYRSIVSIKIVYLTVCM